MSQCRMRETQERFRTETQAETEEVTTEGIILEYLPKTFVAVCVLFFLGIIGFSAASAYVNEEERVCTVAEKDRTQKSGSGSDMRIYTEECGTLTVRDIMWRGQFDSADIYSDLGVGNSYQIRTVGWRIPVLSEFPSVVGHPHPVGQ
jgi:hypothetical protein